MFWFVPYLQSCEFTSCLTLNLQIVPPCLEHFSLPRKIVFLTVTGDEFRFTAKQNHDQDMLSYAIQLTAI